LKKQTLLDQKIYTRFDAGESLPELYSDLLSEQKRTWADLQKGYELLKEVRIRDITCRGFSVRLQYNPGRVKSSTAGVSQDNINERKCFLCLDHLPEDQKGILYRENYLILCNPMPVFSSHFTVSHLNHCPQAITESIGTFLQLMADLGPGWMTLYNGPRCGASAPDHLHFQIIPSGQMPIEQEILKKKRLLLMKKIEGVFFYRIGNLGREVLLLEGEEMTALDHVFLKYLNGLKKVLKIEVEPMINMVGYCRDAKFRLLIFPRRKHRPGLFFKPEDERRVISPGVIDMGGVLITPVEKDFKELTGSMVESIFEEVSLEREKIEKALSFMECV
jgi:hypothetical protein